MVRYSILIALLAYCLHPPAAENTVVFKETFSYPDGALPAHWWAEGDTAVIKNKRLYVNANQNTHRCATVWLKKQFSGNVQIEYDVHVAASRDQANNNNFFLFFSDPGGNLYQSRNSRKDGAYKKYHGMNGYILTNLSNGQPVARTRFRDCPGFHLLDEEKKGQIKQGVTYRIKIVKRGNRIQYWMDDLMIFDKADDEHNPVHQQGHIGFRTWHTELWWDNLVVKQIGK